MGFLLGHRRPDRRHARHRRPGGRFRGCALLAFGWLARRRVWAVAGSAPENRTRCQRGCAWAYARVEGRPGRSGIGHHLTHDEEALARCSRPPGPDAPGDQSHQARGPRPRWYDGGLWGRPLDTALLDVRFREQFLDAHATVIADQERAGLDILTNGDYHLDEDFAGRSWHHYPLQRWKGLEHEGCSTSARATGCSRSRPGR